MAELADAHGSGPCDSNIMRVQVPFSAVKRSIRQNRPLFLLWLHVEALMKCDVITDINYISVF